MRDLLAWLEKSLTALSRGQVWWLIIASVSGIAVANCLGQPTGVRLGRLAVLPVCLASWRLSLRSGLSVGLVSTVLTAATSIFALEHIPNGASANFLLHLFSLAITAAFVSSFRQSFMRERVIARRDGITGALTRLAFEQKAAEMIITASERRQPLLLAYVDLDGFKQVNDRFGHDAGDQVLKRFGTEGGAVLRSSDCFGRMGGDEFAVMVPVASTEEGSTMARELHKRFTEVLSRTNHEVTCSMGALVVAPDGATSLDTLVRRADGLMYAAKRDGKNGMRFDSGAPPFLLEFPASERVGEAPPTEDYSGGIETGPGKCWAHVGSGPQPGFVPTHDGRQRPSPNMATIQSMNTRTRGKSRRFWG